MKIVATIIMAIIGLIYICLTLGYFADLWGGLGFFGSLLTMPISIFAFALITTLSNWFMAIVNIVCISLFFTLWSYVSGE